MSAPHTEGSFTPGPTQAEVRAEHESLGHMFSSMTEKVSILVRQEVALAKAEATDSAKKAGKGAGFLAGAAVAGFFTLMFLSLMLMWLLDEVMHLGLAALIVAILWGIIAAVLALLGKKHLEKIKGLPQTQQTLQEIPETLNPAKETR
ncbi:phage holin family protein [Brachybacterium sp. EF45031]|uniref:phage holin family protein n=1 Tax=Brachybacterium sillae TaxID=2810536 RepID=UPI00217D874B|nr:phage holin family protein [Brachybacterium sillae]MCS6711443.1 phage holin family protein [Brachybacterium sillae]